MMPRVRPAISRYVATPLALVVIVAVVSTPAIGQAIERRLAYERVFAVDWSPDGARFAVARDRTVDILDTATRALLLRLPRHPSRAESIDFCPSGARIATGTRHGTARVFDSTTGVVLLTIPGHDGVDTVRFSADGTSLLVGGSSDRIRDGSATRYDSRTGRRMVTYGGQPGANTAEIDPLGKHVVTRGNARMHLFDATSGRRIRDLAPGGDFGYRGIVDFSPDGSAVVIAVDNEARIYTVPDGVLVGAFTDHTDQVEAVSWSADGSAILSGSDDLTVRLWDAQSFVESGRLEGFEDDVREVRFSPDDGQVLTASDEATGLRIWDLASRTQIDWRTGHDDWSIRSATWSADETQVLTAGRLDGRLWDVATGADVAGIELATGFGVCVASLPGGPRYVSFEDGTVVLWDLLAGTEIRRFAGHTDGVWEAAFTADGATMLTGSSDRTAKLWDVATGTLERTFTGHTDDVMAVAISPDGVRVATAGRDQTVRLHDRATGDLVWSSTSPDEPVTCLAFSPDGQKLAAGSWDDRVRVWNASTGAPLHTLDHGDDVDSVCFSADGTLIASGGEYPVHEYPLRDSLAMIWDVASGARVETLSGHFSAVLSVGFSSDGTRLLTGGRDGAAVIWDWRDDAPRITEGPRPRKDRGKPGVPVDWVVRATDDEGGPLAVTWGFGDGATAVGEEVSHAWAREGVYQVSVTVSDGVTAIMESREFVVGDPEDPRLGMKLDHRRDARDKLELKMEAPFDLPAGWTPEGTELEVTVTSVLREIDLRAGATVTLDDSGRGKGDGIKARLVRRGSGDIFKLRLKLKRQDFGIGDESPDDVEEWVRGWDDERVPVTIRVRVDDRDVWSTSGIYVYRSRDNRKGKIRR